MSGQHVHVKHLIQAPPSAEMEYVRSVILPIFQLYLLKEFLTLARLGKSGLKVSRIILGAMSFGSKDWQKWVLEEEEALPILEHAYNVGINTWDTVHSTLKLLSR
jgi:hypothetical protein